MVGVRLHAYDVLYVQPVSDTGLGLDGGAQHRRLPRPGGALDEDEPVAAGDGAGGVGLGDVQPGDLDHPRRDGLVGLAVHGPREHLFLLGEDVVARVLRGGRFDPHRPPIGVPATIPAPVPGPVPTGFGIQVHTRLQHPVDHALHRLRPPAGLHRLHRGEITHHPHDISAGPRGAGGGQPVEQVDQGE